ncbi:MAG: hypothetical protein QM796_10780 [Chthoniobacteraceae bacterium]
MNPEDLKDTLTSTGRAAYERVNQSLDLARERSGHHVRTSVRYVRQNPVPFIAGALVAGFAIAWLVSRRSPVATTWRERYLDDRLDGARGWLKDQLGPVSEAAQRSVRSAGDVLDEARQKIADLDVNQYVNPLIEGAKRARSRFNFWQ